MSVFIGRGHSKILLWWKRFISSVIRKSPSQGSVGRRPYGKQTFERYYMEEGLQRVFYGKRTLKRSSIQYIPSQGLLQEDNLHNFFFKKKSFARSCVERSPPQGVLQEEDVPKIFYGKKAFKKPSMERTPSMRIPSSDLLCKYGFHKLF